MDTNFILLVIAQYYQHLFCSSKLSQSLSCSATSLFRFLIHFLIFWYHKMFQAHLAFYLPSPRIQPFIQGCLLSFVGEWYEPRSGCYQYMCLPLMQCHYSWHFRRQYKGNIYLYFFLYLFLYVLKSKISSYWYLQSNKLPHS